MTAVPSELVVRTVPGPIHRHFRLRLLSAFLIGVLGLGFIVPAWAVNLRGASGAVMVFGGLLLLATAAVVAGYICYQWGSRMALSEPLRVSASGIECQSHLGQVVLPWQAITSVQRLQKPGGQVLLFAIHPEAMPGHHGVVATELAWRRLRQRTGVTLGSQGIDPGLDEIVAAVQAYTGGRMPIHE